MILSNKLKKILMWHELLPLSLAIYLGTVLQKFLESFVKDITMPAILLLMPTKVRNNNYLQSFNEYGFNFTDAISHIFTLFIAIYVCYLFIKLFADKNI